jgi:hypothetical protein
MSVDLPAPPGRARQILLPDVAARYCCQILLPDIAGHVVQRVLKPRFFFLRSMTFYDVASNMGPPDIAGHGIQRVLKPHFFLSLS